MKKFLQLLGLGLFNVAMLFLFLKYVTFSISYGIFFVSILLFITGIIATKITVKPLLKTLIICLPTVLFSILFISEAKNLWPIIIYIPLITFFGVNFSSKKIVFAPIAALLITFFSLYVVPNLLFKSLTIHPDETLTEYKFIDLLNNKEITPKDQKSNILVLSFFNTWCKPCIKEFPELAKLKEKYADKKVKVILVCAGEMDTQEKVMNFYKKRALEFDLWYDEKSEVYKKHKMNGVPSVMIIDEKGKPIHIHSGYNEGINIVRQLSKIIDSRID